MRRHFSYIINFFIGFNSFYYQSAAQDGILKGKVRGNPEILHGATVSAGINTVTTNEAGEFTILLKAGNHKITVSYTGYKPAWQEVKITAGDTTVADIILETAEQLKAVVLIGSRSSTQRSSMNSAVPVDVILGTKLPRAATSLTDQLFLVVPSFNSPPQTVGPSAYASPATLRGLGPEHTLGLVNGHRRHTTPSVLLQYSLGYGSVFTDLNSIPAAAIDNIQILRDGASAQYGSDAIAGVIDLQLKKTTGQTEINLHLGEFYEGDGETISFDINRGFGFKKKGFLNFTIASRFSKPTQRNGWYDSTVYKNIPRNVSPHIRDSLRDSDDSLVAASGFDRLNHRRIGSPQIFNTSLIVNGAYPINQSTNLYLLGTVNYRKVKDRGSNLYRYPKDPTTVIKELYPDGFQIIVDATQSNLSLIAGIEGKTINDWRWDLSSSIGSNSSGSILNNSNNASQYLSGKSAQTRFEPGTNIFTQITNNISFTRNFKNPIGNFKYASVAFGGEFRIENYNAKAGEEASWKNYAPGSGRMWGSQGVGGRPDSALVNEYRYVGAVYLDLESDINTKLLINVAGRYEYYNDFGGNIAGKIALRYKITHNFSIRGSASNGFRAPSLAQRYYNNISPSANVGSITMTETFGNTSHTAEAFGVSPLAAEKSINLSVGITSALSKHINITLDAYWIQISDRVTLSGSIHRDSSTSVKNILQDISKTDIVSIRFFSNAVSTRTKGIDLVATGIWPIKKSILEISLSANYNKTKIYRINNPAKNLPGDSLHLYTLINPEERGRLQEAQPLGKVIMYMNYKTGKWEFGGRGIYFGKAAHIFSGADRSRDEFFSPKILAGASIGYSPNSWMTIKAGARNIFNNYPDKIKNRANMQGGLVNYDFNSTQIGYNGGYCFLLMNFNF